MISSFVNRVFVFESMRGKENGTDRNELLTNLAFSSFPFLQTRLTRRSMMVNLHNEANIYCQTLLSKT